MIMGQSLNLVNPPGRPGNRDRHGVTSDSVIQVIVTPSLAEPGLDSVAVTVTRNGPGDTDPARKSGSLSRLRVTLARARW